MGILKGTAGLPDLSGLVALVVDEAAAVRQQLRATLLELGAHRVETANSIYEARRQLDKRVIDLIFCNHDQGTGVTGQEWMEELKADPGRSRQSSFIMLSADAHYATVVGTVEVPPDAFLLKPFTISHVLTRLSTLVTKRKALSPLYRALTESPETAQAVLERLCQASNASAGAHYSEIAQLLAKLYERTGQRTKLLGFYDQVILDSALPWAKLGRAQCLHKSGELVEAEEAFTRVVADHPTYLAAYQATAEFYSTSGSSDKALSVVEAALRISPNSLKRLRQAGELALANGDHAKAAKYLEYALRASVGSSQPDSRLEFQVTLAQLTQQRYREAMALVQAMKERKQSDESKVYVMLAEAAVLYARGIVDQACKQFGQVVQQLHTAKLSVTTSLDCLAGMAYAWCSKSRDMLKAPVKQLVHRLVNSNHVADRVQAAIKYASVDLKNCVAASSDELVFWSNKGVQLMADRKPVEAAQHLAQVGIRTGNSRLLLTAVNACTKAWTARAEDGLKKLAQDCLDRLDLDLDQSVRDRLLLAFR